jgi:sterol desaturase/sphingolipid hydroxylase (fatty acid hydroxylase superfamily)
MAKANYGNLPINHDEEPIRLFKSDALEFFTHIHPAVVLALFVPVVLYFLGGAILSRSAGESIWPILGGYVGGILVWTFAEYMLHRYLFHYEPTHPRAKWVWYLIHGVHHEQPQCKTRLVMPPVLSIPLAFVFYGLFHVVVGTVFGAPRWIGPLFAGFVTGYLMYDMLHYAEHHLSMKWGFLKHLKRYHLLHHFKTPDDRFGVSSPLWDHVFGTKPKDS